MTDFNDTNRNNAPVQPEPAAADAARTEPQAAPAEAQAPAAETAGAQNAPETAPAEENAAPKLTVDPAEVAARAEAVVAEIEDAEIPPAPEMPVPPVQNTAAQPPYTPPPAPQPPVYQQSYYQPPQYTQQAAPYQPPQYTQSAPAQDQQGQTPGRQGQTGIGVRRQGAPQQQDERKAEQAHDDGRHTRQQVHSQTDAALLGRRGVFAQIQPAAHAGEHGQAQGQSHQTQRARASGPYAVPHRTQAEQGLAGRRASEKQVRSQSGQPAPQQIPDQGEHGPGHQHGRQPGRPPHERHSRGSAHTPPPAASVPRVAAARSLRSRWRTVRLTAALTASSSTPAMNNEL